MTIQLLTLSANKQAGGSYTTLLAKQGGIVSKKLDFKMKRISLTQPLERDLYTLQGSVLWKRVQERR